MADDSIKDWSSNPAENGPQGNELIGTTLDDQLRNIKAIVRAETLDKQWIRVPYQIERVSETIFRIKGALGGVEGSTALVQRNRKVVMIAADFSQSVGTITAQESETYQSQTWTKVTITPAVYGGSVPTNLIEVKFGAITSLTGGLPGNVLLSSSNTLYSSSVLRNTAEETAANAGASTWFYNISLPSTIGQGLSDGQVFYIQMPATTPGNVWLQINTTFWLPIKKLAVSSSQTLLPVATFQQLDAGDISAGQVIVVAYRAVAGSGSFFHLLSPVANAASYTDLANLFALDDETYDLPTCEAGGYVKLMKNTAFVWCQTKVIPSSDGTAFSSLAVTLPLFGTGPGKIGLVYSVIASPIYATGVAKPLLVEFQGSNGTILLKHQNTVAVKAYVHALVSLLS